MSGGGGGKRVGSTVGGERISFLKKIARAVRNVLPARMTIGKETIHA
jgi:hypothetical protein